MSLFTVFATSKVAAGVLAAGTLAVGGTGVAAVAGALPADVQQSAHELLGAPAPHAGGVSTTATAKAAAAADGNATVTESGAKADAKVSGSSAAAVGADAAGAAAFGLCTAFANGGLNAGSTGFTSLAVAANGETNIEGYCAEVSAKGQSASHKAEVAGSGSANVKAAVPAVPAAPAVPELPGQASVPAVPAVPAVPSHVPTDAVDAPSVAGRP
ncbi:protein tyrosine phosphatase [Pseudarthrobacter sp. N5]|uniref:protein tyrosine phosphatase n=1 Tax=Pseudarthrobacter sp. N5 TaxID=3418416 RepID=UPI003CED967A